MSQAALVPKLRFSEFSDDWEEKRFVDITTKISDGIHSTPNYDEGGTYSFVNGNNLVNGVIKINSQTKKVDENEYTTHQRPLGSNTILISINGTIGNLALYNNEKVVLGKSACYLNINEKDTDKLYVFNLLRTCKIKRFFNSELTGSTIKNLSLTTIKNTKLNLPTKPEQQKIAAFLTAVDTKIEQLSKKQELLGEYKKGSMQQIFSQAIRFKADDGSAFPDWEEKKLGDVGNFYRGHSYNSTNVKDSGLLVLRSSNIKNDSLILDNDLQFVNKDCSDNISLKTNDIVICMANGSKRLVGKSGIYHGDYNGKLTVGAFCSIFRTDNLLSKYILQTVQYRKYLHILLAGTNINNLKNSELSELTFNLPVSSFEQTKIASFLSSIDRKIEQVGKQLDESNQFKKALLQQMFV